MWFGSSRRFLYLSVVVLLVTTLLQMWVCCHSCQVEAIRVFPAKAVANVEFNRGTMHNKSKKKKDLFDKYFSGRTSFDPSNRTNKGFDESKRRVPSCPDPLHN